VAQTKQSSLKIAATSGFRALFAQPAIVGSVTRRAGRSLRAVHSSPNVYVIDQFLTNAECEFLLGTVTSNDRKFKVYCFVCLFVVWFLVM
jgi:hypothetical protein